MQLMRIAILFVILMLGACTDEAHVVMSDTSRAEYIAQLEARGSAESYKIFVLLRTNSGNLVHEQEIIGNIDLPGDIKQYVAYMRARDEIVLIGVLDIPYIEQLDPQFRNHIQMCRYSEVDFQNIHSKIDIGIDRECDANE